MLPGSTKTHTHPREGPHGVGEGIAPTAAGRSQHAPSAHWRTSRFHASAQTGPCCRTTSGSTKATRGSRQEDGERLGGCDDRARVVAQRRIFRRGPEVHTRQRSSLSCRTRTRQTAMARVARTTAVPLYAWLHVEAPLGTRGARGEGYRTHGKKTVTAFAVRTTVHESSRCCAYGSTKSCSRAPRTSWPTSACSFAVAAAGVRP
jgi:hypothetical protein